MRNLAGADKADLKRTYSFLLATSEEDPRVAKLKVEKLRIMINVRIIELMPMYCKRCNSGKPHYTMVGEVPKVSCRRCRKQACPSCYGEEERMQAVNKWKYLCEDCDEIVSKETGEEALEAKYLDKAFMKRIAQKTEPVNKTTEVEPAKEPAEEDAAGKKPNEVDMFAPTQETRQELVQKKQNLYRRSRRC